jgi:MoaD family protein
VKIVVQFSGQLRSLVGDREVTWDCPDAIGLHELLALIAARYPDCREHLLAAEGVVRPSLLLVVNGVAVSAEAAAQTALRAGDVVALLPPIAGG